MTIQYDYSTLIGGFRPYHLGHHKVVCEGLAKSDFVIIVVGSNNRSRSTRLPFTAKERIRMIRAGLDDELSQRVLITSVPDFAYNDTRWNAAVQAAVQKQIAINNIRGVKYTNRGFKDYNNSIALLGMYKDGTSYYLNNFPQWNKSIAVAPEVDDGTVLSATAIRNKLFNGELDYDKDMIPAVKAEMLKIIDEMGDEWDRLKSDWNYEQKYSSIYGHGPFITVDACVVQAGHVLLVERGGDYGKGLLAMPGGFLNRNEKIRDGMIRELREETRIKVPEKVLRGSITETEVFDDPFRSNRARIITHAFKIELNNDPNGLPKVVGSDDAAKAKWYPISSIANMPHMFFEDHFFCLSKLLEI